MSTQQLFGARDYRLDSLESRRDRVVVAYSWADGDGRRHRWAQALQLKHGKIIDMQDYGHPRSALVVMRLRTAFA
jgi:hypothetical protein